MAEAARFRLGPLVTLAIDPPALQQWLRTAKAGEMIVYAQGQVPPRDRPIWAAVREAVALGLIVTHEQRGGAVITYLARRVAAPIAVHDAGADVVARVFAEVSRCAEAGLPMPTDLELARRCGLDDASGAPSANKASYALRLLRDAAAGARRLQIINWGPCERRQACVLATGKMTPRAPLYDRKDAA